ncbi:hypothetical protein TPHA_0P00140 [Tetrapisispora phaffii CBS 4417]|uniref:Rdx family-domain-containing protein n=1 Tax=Tetrapisispora phaffii (strain ATCC 24235 / CBS 4417 / NBRC 1672 / NRRL Y-8282 / UCD 70-5) TaxID=1071381 RepID=G8C1Z4_TETPH|nr:hypothetical protein TPHA_0P00140 [Tetrapisispora phaffii CBS 4417]CCE66172.1 hypothetical protein TPHA_0P00140 [Tetrapisispora phaffii CBS 4417]
MSFPKIDVLFCTKCKWNLRAAWYAQELLQTFDDKLGQVALVPAETGEFKILAYETKQDYIDDKAVTLWDRKVDGGFPDSKFLKQRAKQLVFRDSVKVGAHIERVTATQGLVSEDSTARNGQYSSDNSKQCTECQDN